MARQIAVYILASKRNGTLYVGVTSNLVQRIWQHRNNLAEGFTQRYQVHQLVCYELYEDIRVAIKRESRCRSARAIISLQGDQ